LPKKFGLALRSLVPRVSLELRLVPAEAAAHGLLVGQRGNGSIEVRYLGSIRRAHDLTALNEDFVCRVVTRDVRILPRNVQKTLDQLLIPVVFEAQPRRLSTVLNSATQEVVELVPGDEVTDRLRRIGLLRLRKRLLVARGCARRIPLRRNLTLLWRFYPPVIRLRWR